MVEEDELLAGYVSDEGKPLAGYLGDEGILPIGKGGGGGGGGEDVAASVALIEYPQLPQKVLRESIGVPHCRQDIEAISYTPSNHEISFLKEAESLKVQNYNASINQ